MPPNQEGMPGGPGMPPGFFPVSLHTALLIFQRNEI